MEVETGEVKEHPTYKRIQEYVQEKYGFKVHTAYIAEVKRWSGWICTKRRTQWSRENMSIIPARLKRSRQSRMRCGILA